MGSFDDPTEHPVANEDRTKLGIKRGNGTIVTIKVDQKVRCPRHDTLLDKLSKHYQLRDINSDPRRELTLHDLNKGTTDRIRYGQQSSQQADIREIVVPGYPSASVSLKILRLTERCENLSSDTGRPEGLLVKGRRAIYENTLFSFENNPHAHWFAGSVICEYIDTLALEYDNTESEGGEHSTANPMAIISRSRDGLEHEHPFYKALVDVVEPLLKELVKKEEEKATEEGVHENTRLRRSLNTLGRELGQLVDADLRDIDEDGLRGGPGSGDTEPLRIIPENPVLYLGEDKTLSVVALRSLETNEIDVEVDSEGVVEFLDTFPVTLSDHPRREEYVIGQIRIRPLIENEETLLTVNFGSAKTEALIEVKPEREFPDPDPPDDLEFERTRYQFAHNKRRSILIRAPVQVVNNAGTMTVQIISSDVGVVVFGNSVNLRLDEEAYCFLGRAEIDPRVLGARATLTASLGNSHATCEAIVAERESGGPRLEIQISDEEQGRYRAYVESKEEVTIINIIGGHPAIKRYLGPGPEFPHQDSHYARLLIAEIVAGEAARLVVQRKNSVPGDLDGPAFYAEHLLYLTKYLPRCQKTMLGDSEVIN